MKQNTFRLSVLFATLIVLWGISVFVYQTLLWLILINLTAIFWLIKDKKIDKADVLIGVLLGGVCMLSKNILGISVVLPYIAAQTVFKKSKNGLSFYKKQNAKTVIYTLLLIFVAGGGLGATNVFLAMGSIPFHLSFKMEHSVNALCAGVFEEVLFRFFFFALCLYMMSDKEISKMQNFLCYAIMIIPHVLLHFDFTNFQIVNAVMLSLLFGLPFAWMQRKHNLISAIGAHALVDLIRFCVFGV